MFDRLAAETGNAIQWHKVGSLRLASSPDRWSEIRRSMTQAKSFGVECDSALGRRGEGAVPVHHHRRRRRRGLHRRRRLCRSLRADPGLREGGARRRRHDRGRRHRHRHRHRRPPRDGGRHRPRHHRLRHPRQLRRPLGQARRRDGGRRDRRGRRRAPVFPHREDADAAREPHHAPRSRQQFLPQARHRQLRHRRLGGRHAAAAGAACRRSISAASCSTPTTTGWRCSRGLAAERLPVLNETGIQTVINGPIPVSADGEPIMGRAPELDNFYLACGFTAGIAASGGAGEALANWIVEGDPGMDLWQFDVRRFGAVQAQGRYLEERAIEAYGAYYKIHWPNEEQHSARPLRRSPLYDRLNAAGAVNGQKFGWERPNWFAAPGEDAHDRPSFEGKPNWFDAVAREVDAIRNRVALIDQTSFAKFEIAGDGRARRARPHRRQQDPETPGRRRLHPALQRQGRHRGRRHDRPLRARTASSSSPARASASATAPGSGRNCPTACTMRDVTGAFATINICGPRARDVLQAVTDSDVSNAALPVPRRARDRDRLHAARSPSASAMSASSATSSMSGRSSRSTSTTRSGKPAQQHGIANAGYRAIESCRLEKGYLYWSGDITPDTNPYEAGLGFAVRPRQARLHRQGGARRDQGRRARAEARRPSPSTASCRSTAASRSCSTATVVGSVTSAGFGHHLGKTIGFGYVPASARRPQGLRDRGLRQVLPGDQGPARLYDAKKERLKGMSPGRHRRYRRGPRRAARHPAVCRLARRRRSPGSAA